MALIMRLKNMDSVKILLEDGREVTVCVETYSKNRTIAYVDAPSSIRVERIQKKLKDDDERTRNSRD